jgi:transcriptional regulator with XRE-family HTH domain
MEAREFIAALLNSGMTQVQIADRTGIPQPTISKVARGEVKDVMSQSYRKLQSLHDEVFSAPSAGASGAPNPEPNQEVRDAA